MNWLIKASKEIEDKNQVKVFGAIIYDESHPYLIKVLRDEDFWNALNKVSGDKWSIFAIKPLGEKERLLTNRACNEPINGMMNYMLPVYSQKIEGNKKVLNSLGINANDSDPSLIIFAELNNEIYRLRIRLETCSQEKTYQFLQQKMKLVADTIDQIEEKNLSNVEGVFTAISFALDQDNKFKSFVKGISLLKWVKDNFS